MKARDIHLQYRFGPGHDNGTAVRQAGATIENPLFDLLSALAAAGSIQQAARHLGISYRHLWGSLKNWETTLGEELVQWVRGQPARLTPFAERLLWSERQARTRMAPHIEALRHELQRVLAEALDGSRQVLRVDASHDLALPALQQLAADAVGLHLELRFAGSFDALQALAEGRCVVAGFHVPRRVQRNSLYAQAMRPLLKPGRHKLLACMQRQQGLMVARGNPLALASMADVVRLRGRYADREPGAGTHVLTDHLLHLAGLSRADLNVTDTGNSHVAVALAVASGRADAALGLQAAAAQAGLDFVPLVEEDYFLVCLPDALDTPAVTALRAALALPAWSVHLATLQGYQAADQPGAVRSLVQALPWWSFRRSTRALEQADERHDR